MTKRNIIVLYDKDIYKMFSSKDLDTLFMVGIKDGHPWRMQFQVQLHVVDSDDVAIFFHFLKELLFRSGIIARAIFIWT
jgi:hypothetical protein